MITHIHGTLVSKSLTEAVVDVSGVGYLMHISLRCYERLPSVNSSVRLLTYLHVREDAMLLFGFDSESERNMFLSLVSISGIGPKMAMNVLSGRNPEELRELVRTGNVAALTSIPGIGKKTAERMVVELKDKFSKESLPTGMTGQFQPSDVRAESVQALMALGYSRTQAETAVVGAYQLLESSDLSVEEVIRHVLKRGI